MRSKIPKPFFILLVSTALLSACASAPPGATQDAIGTAQYAIMQAKQAGSDDTQSVTLYDAEQKLDQARNLVSKKDYTGANRHAEEATLDAQLAQAQAEARQAQKQKADLEETLKTLRGDLQQGGAEQ